MRAATVRERTRRVVMSRTAETAVRRTWRRPRNVTTAGRRRRSECRIATRNEATAERLPVDARLKDRSHRTDGDADGRGDGDRGHRAAERDQLSSDDAMSGNRSGDVHRRSADAAAGKSSEERGTHGLVLTSETNYVSCMLLVLSLHAVLP